METALERKAESLSLTSYERAMDEYRANPCGLFESKFLEPDAPTYGESLADRFEMSAKKMSFVLSTPELLTPDECDRLIAAFQLSYDIHYNENTFVGNGGNSSEGSEFDEEERWESSEETDIRKTVWDVNTPYRLMRTDAFKGIFKQIPMTTFAPNVIISGMVARKRLRFFEICVPQHDRTTGEVSIKKWKLLKAAAKSFGQTIGFAFKRG